MTDIKPCDSVGKIQLGNDRLAVDIAYPGTVYKGSRFDWNGFIAQVTLDEKYSFCVPESLIPGKGSGGQGLCGEFGIDEALGYIEAGAGDYFTKPGVGLLKKTDAKPYDFFRAYQVIPVETDIRTTNDSAVFSVYSKEYKGHAYDYRKEIKVNGNCLVISYFLKNTGSKVIATTEYCHNFIGIDNQLVSGDYKLKLPFNIQAEKTVGDILINNSEITWPDTGLNGEFYCVIKGYEESGDYSWELCNSKFGVGIREKDDFRIFRFALWGSKHVVSPEAFVGIDLQPGKSKTWERKYEFYNQNNTNRT